MDFKPLVTLLAIVNPLAIVPFFIHYTQDFTREQRRRTIWISSFSAFVVIAVSALMGLHILNFFGISLASFQIGGEQLLVGKLFFTIMVKGTFRTEFFEVHLSRCNDMLLNPF